MIPLEHEFFFINSSVETYSLTLLPNSSKVYLFFLYSSIKAIIFFLFSMSKFFMFSKSVFVSICFSKRSFISLINLKSVKVLLKNLLLS